MFGSAWQLGSGSARYVPQLYWSLPWCIEFGATDLSCQFVQCCANGNVIGLLFKWPQQPRFSSTCRAGASEYYRHPKRRQRVRIRSTFYDVCNITRHTFTAATWNAALTIQLLLPMWFGILHAAVGHVCDPAACLASRQAYFYVMKMDKGRYVACVPVEDSSPQAIFLLRNCRSQVSGHNRHEV